MKKKNIPDTTKTGNGVVQLIRMDGSTREMWVKTPVTHSLWKKFCSYSVNFIDCLTHLGYPTERERERERDREIERERQRDRERERVRETEREGQRERERERDRDGENEGNQHDAAIKQQGVSIKLKKERKSAFSKVEVYYKSETADDLIVFCQY